VQADGFHPWKAGGSNNSILSIKTPRDQKSRNHLKSFFHVGRMPVLEIPDPVEGFPGSL
jgi:hypothetical protein